MGLSFQNLSVEEFSEVPRICFPARVFPGQHKAGNGGGEGMGSVVAALGPEVPLKEAELN